MSLLQERPLDIPFVMPDAEVIAFDEYEAFSAPFQSPEAEQAYQANVAEMSAPAPDERVDDPSMIAMERIRVARELTTLLGIKPDVYTVSVAVDGLEVIGVPTEDPYDREITAIVLRHYMESRQRQAAIDGARHNLGELAVEIFGEDVPSFLASDADQAAA